MSDYAPDVVAARREKLSAMPLGTRIVMARAVTAAVGKPQTNRRIR